MADRKRKYFDMGRGSARLHLTSQDSRYEIIRDDFSDAGHVVDYGARPDAEDVAAAERTLQAVSVRITAAAAQLKLSAEAAAATFDRLSSLTSPKPGLQVFGGGHQAAARVEAWQDFARLDPHVADFFGDGGQRLTLQTPAGALEADSLEHWSALNPVAVLHGAAFAIPLEPGQPTHLPSPSFTLEAPRILQPRDCQAGGEKHCHRCPDPQCGDNMRKVCWAPGCGGWATRSRVRRRRGAGWRCEKCGRLFTTSKTENADERERDAPRSRRVRGVRGVRVQADSVLNLHGQRRGHGGRGQVQHLRRRRRKG